MKKELIALSAITFCCMSLSAKEIELNSTITAATVYDNRAAITRTIKAQLDSGDNTIVIRGLPGSVLVDSLRVSGSGTNKIEIASVEARRSFSKQFNNEKESDIRFNIQSMQDQHKAYQDQIEALDLQKTFMTSLVQSQPNLLRENLETGNIDPTTWQSAWSLIQSGSSDMLKMRTAAVIAQREINKEIKLLNQELSQLATGQKQTVDAYIAVSTNSETSGQLFLEYQIPGASWSPLYDARLDTNKARLRIDQLASVSQTTGEDWSNVKLSLSTHRPSANASFNPVNPWALNFNDYNHQQNRRTYNEKSSDRFLKSDSVSVEEIIVTGAKLESEVAEMQNATMSVSAFSAEYHIPGKITLSSERKARKFKIKDQSFDSKLLVMAAPHRSTKAYLHAQLNYTGDELLLPGQVALFRDNAFVGNTQLGLLRPEEDTKLSFGIDDAINIEYKSLKEETGTNGIVNKRDYIERNFKTTVHNFHKQTIELRILNRLPVAQHESIKVEANNKNSTPSETDVDNLKGVMAWDFELKPDQENVIDFGYMISYPAGRSIY